MSRPITCPARTHTHIWGADFTSSNSHSQRDVDLHIIKYKQKNKNFCKLILIILFLIQNVG